MTIHKGDVPQVPVFTGDMDGWVTDMGIYVQQFLQAHVDWLREIVADVSSCDASSHWTRTGTELNPSVAGDAVDTTGFVRMARLLAGGVDE